MFVPRLFASAKQNQAMCSPHGFIHTSYRFGGIAGIGKNVSGLGLCFQWDLVRGSRGDALQKLEVFFAG